MVAVRAASSGMIGVDTRNLSQRFPGPIWMTVRSMPRCRTLLVCLVAARSPGRGVVLCFLFWADGLGLGNCRLGECIFNQALAFACIIRNTPESQKSFPDKISGAGAQWQGDFPGQFAFQVGSCSLAADGGNKRGVGGPQGV